MIDTHCHLTNKKIKSNICALLSRAAEAGVDIVLSATATLQDSIDAGRISRKYESVFCTSGIHPHDAAGVDEDAIRQIGELASGNDKCVAIGEIGLDYHYDFSPREDQQRVFAEQLQLAMQLGMKVVIHTREAFDDTMSIIINSGIETRGLIFHSFTGNPAQGRKVIDLGSTISFSGIATFSTAGEIRETAAMVPDDRVLVETDAPYLSPAPVRKIHPNEPANVVHVARLIAEIRGMTYEQFDELVCNNARNILGLHLD